MPEQTSDLVWECGPHANSWNGHDARCRKARVVPKCQWRERMKSGWERVPCGRDALPDWTHCDRHTIPCDRQDGHEPHVWARPSRGVDQPGSLGCVGVNAPGPEAVEAEVRWQQDYATRCRRAEVLAEQFYLAVMNATTDQWPLWITTGDDVRSGYYDLAYDVVDLIEEADRG